MSSNIETYKIILLGTSGVGKSAIITQFIYKKFVDIYNPTIEDSYQKNFTFLNKDYILEILDTSGSDKFSYIRDMNIESSDGFILVYSLMDEESFDSLDDFYNKILHIKKTKIFPCLIVGNKLDLVNNRIISYKNAKNFAKSKNCHYIEISSEKYYDVLDIFTNLTYQINKYNDSTYITEKSYKKLNNCIIL